ncbi:MAG: hypothetical protein A2075_20950 [Geobacteraceae bacterium GWC2_58_44]|nr:MAG: hypothetical protein A2075_20950 [Geobacteraceae bacterium GWC2_58_44]HBG05251.1 hypothetical protein [Geobacter sp.]
MGLHISCLCNFSVLRRFSLSKQKEAEKKKEREARRVVTLELPDEFLDLCDMVQIDPAEVLRGFVADLCDLRSGEYHTNGSDERYLAEQYFERCGYRWNH